jgi:hypothetical protein
MVVKMVRVDGRSGNDVLLESHNSNARVTGIDLLDAIIIAILNVFKKKAESTKICEQSSLALCPFPQPEEDGGGHERRIVTIANFGDVNELKCVKWEGLNTFAVSAAEVYDPDDSTSKEFVEHIVTAVVQSGKAVRSNVLIQLSFLLMKYKSDASVGAKTKRLATDVYELLKVTHTKEDADEELERLKAQAALEKYKSKRCLLL